MDADTNHIAKCYADPVLMCVTVDKYMLCTLVEVVVDYAHFYYCL